MSNFLTKIPISIDDTKKLLPKDASIEKIFFNAQTSEVEVTWHHPRLHTGFTFPHPFSLDELKNKALPKGVKDLGPFVPKPKPTQAIVTRNTSSVVVPPEGKAENPKAAPRPRTPRAPKPKPVSVAV